MQKTGNGEQVVGLAVNALEGVVRPASSTTIAPTVLLSNRMP
ncbi:hypothetical protein [Streptomyces sp. NPDC051577]